MYPPSIECRVSYRAGASGNERAARASFTGALAQYLKRVLHDMLGAVIQPVPALSKFDVAAWTEVIKQGGAHRPELLVELTIAAGVSPEVYEAQAEEITTAFVQLVAAFAMMTDTTGAEPGFRTVTVWTLLPGRAGVAVQLDDGKIIDSVGSTALEKGMAISITDPVLLRSQPTP